MPLSIGSMSLTDLGRAFDVGNAAGTLRNNQDSDIQLELPEAASMETQRHTGHTSVTNAPQGQEVKVGQQGSIEMPMGSKKAASAITSTQTRVKAKTHVMIREWFKSFMAVIAIMTAALYFYLQYRQSSYANRLALEETCRAHAYNKYVQSLPTCKAGRHKGDVDLDRRAFPSVRNVTKIGQILLKSTQALPKTNKPNTFKLIMAETTRSILHGNYSIMAKVVADAFSHKIVLWHLWIPVLADATDGEKWLQLWLSIWLICYIKKIGNIISYWTYRSIPIPEHPSFQSHDVTIIIPTIHNNFFELKDTLRSILACSPHEVLIVTTANKYSKLVSFVKTLGDKNIKMFQVPVANKRIQIYEIIPLVKTEFTIIVDDDVTWPKTILPWLLAPFEHKDMGSVGPRQQGRRIRSGNTVTARIYNWLGAAYIERYNFETTATHSMDGGTSFIPGRTCAFRTEILQSYRFLHDFKTERWGKFDLHADDDNFIARWLALNNWRTWIQNEKECEIETTLENNVLFLSHCLRRARSRWRSDYTTLFTDKLWRKHPWSTYALRLATFDHIYSSDAIVLLITYQATQDWTRGQQQLAVASQLTFLLVIEATTLLGLLVREPSELIFLPVSILFGFFHQLIEIWALITLRQTVWGSRVGADVNDDVRLSPHPRRNEGITLSSDNHKGLLFHRHVQKMVR